MKRKLFFLFLFIFLLGAVFFLLVARKPARISLNNRGALVFSKYFAERLDSNWKGILDGVLEELKPKILRVPLYWEDVEPEPGEYVFIDYDLILKRAREKGVGVILVVGSDVSPRRGCYVPEWFKERDNSDILESKTLAFLKVVAERYAKEETVTAWELENEPFLDNGCLDGDRHFLQKEMEALRRYGGEKPVFLTADGIRGGAGLGLLGADGLGFRVIYVKGTGWAYGLVNEFLKRVYWFRIETSRWIGGEKELYVYNFKASPEVAETPWNISNREDQEQLMDCSALAGALDEAENLGVERVFFEGAEWWYWVSKKYGEDCFLKQWQEKGL